nr:hypothetical protein [Tanacetum cinerariifolium]
MVAIDGHGGQAQAAEQQRGRAGLRPYATDAFEPGAGLRNGPLGQKIERAGRQVFVAAAAADFAQYFLNAGRLLLGPGAGAQGALHVDSGRVAHLLPGGEAAGVAEQLLRTSIFGGSHGQVAQIQVLDRAVVFREILGFGGAVAAVGVAEAPVGVAPEAAVAKAAQAHAVGRAGIRCVVGGVQADAPGFFAAQGRFAVRVGQRGAHVVAGLVFVEAYIGEVDALLAVEQQVRVPEERRLHFHVGHVV